ncbi:MAG: thioesterase [Ramlibacter sp.]|nr:thioesterase [Ramlibacter sp.]
MRLRLRFLLTLLQAFMRSRLGVLNPSSIWLRVLPNDVDLLHVTNDRYLAYMDLGRNDLSVRIGLFAAVRKLRAYPVVRTLSIRFRHPARLFQKLELRTRILCWSEESAWFEQEFFLRGRSIGLAYCKAEMRTAKGVVSPRTLLDFGNNGAVQSPDRPPLIRLLEEQEQTMKAAQQEPKAVSAVA